MFKVFEMTDLCIRSRTPRALAPSSFFTDFSRFRVAPQYVVYYVVLFNPVTMVSLIQLLYHGPIPCPYLSVFSSSFFLQQAGPNFDTI